MMPGLLNIQYVSVPIELVRKANSHLQRAGKWGAEGVALWAGKQDQDNEVFQVTNTIIPAQTPLRLPSGVCYYVDADELHRINVWLFRSQLTLIAQLHSHPKEAFHSPTDDAFPIATAIGSFSLVIPHFAQRPFSLKDCAVYRLLNSGWIQIHPEDASQLIQING